VKAIRKDLKPKGAGFCKVIGGGICLRGRLVLLALGRVIKRE
jgi:hypothetical protein